tara:strand:+ start:486 stop:749 length:264 start_codon:yes stop_codon:yes gene_type:complete
MIPLSQHADTRCRQRGIRKTDVQFIYEHGTQHGDMMLLSAEDIRRLIHDARDTIARAERLREKAIIVANAQVITVFQRDGRRVQKSV